MTLDRLRMAFGFLLLGILAMLAGAIALGKVEQATSYGLMPLVTALATLAGGFANWAFRNNERSGVDRSSGGSDGEVK